MLVYVRKHHHISSSISLAFSANLTGFLIFLCAALLGVVEVQSVFHDTFLRSHLSDCQLIPVCMAVLFEMPTFWNTFFHATVQLKPELLTLLLVQVFL